MSEIQESAQESQEDAELMDRAKRQAAIASVLGLADSARIACRDVLCGLADNDDDALKVAHSHLALAEVQLAGLLLGEGDGEDGEDDESGPGA